MKFNSEFLVSRTVMEKERIVQILLSEIACARSFSLKRKNKNTQAFIESLLRAKLCAGCFS